MRYVTICHELLQEQCPALHESLRAGRMLLAAVNDYAPALRTSHLGWIDEFRRANPGLDPAQASSRALEMALRDLRDALPCEPPSSGAAETFPLGAAMAYLRAPTPSA